VSQPVEPTPGAPAEPAPPEPGAPAPEPNDPVDVDSLPANVKHLITKLRTENGDNRSKAKAAAAAAEQARTDAMQEFAQKLGLAPETTPDPEALAQQLTQSQVDAASARLELDVWRRITRLGGDPEQLLDSRRFADAIDALEDEDFGTAADAVITDWLTKHPAMRPATARPGRPVESLTPGSMPTPPEPDLDEQIAAAQKAGDYRAVIRLNGQKLSAQKK